MKKQLFTTEKDGFVGAYYGGPEDSKKAVILMLGDSSEDRIASRKMFDESEKRHPIQEEEKIKVERIRGQIIFVGAEDDVLWDTCKYIRRMEQRLTELPHECTWKSFMYKHGTHFVFPESMLKSMLPIASGLLVKFMFKAARNYPKECKETRIDIDKQLRAVLKEW